MKKKIFLLLFTTTALFSQQDVQSPLPPTSVAVTDNALSIFSNPSAVGYRTESQLFGLFPMEEGKFTEEYGAYLMTKNLAFGGEWLENVGSQFYQKWHLSLGFPIWKWINFGFTYRWYGTIDRNSEWNFGTIARPFPWVSAGAVIDNVGKANDLPSVGQVGIAFRPFGDQFTFAADLYKDIDTDDSEPGTRLYAEIEPINGIILSALYFTKESDLRFGVNLNFPKFGVGSVMHTSQDEVTDGSVFVHSSTSKYRSIFKKPEKTVAKLKFSGNIQEEGIPFLSGRLISLKDILDKINDAKENPDVEAILIEFDTFNCGFSKLLEIRNAINDFRNSGKRAFCYADILYNGTYLIASVCDSIYLNPAGTAWITGLTSVSIYFKDILDKLGINAEYEYIAEYKSAHEPFTRDSMSDKNREQMNALLDDFFSVYVEEIAKSRNISEEETRDLIDNGPYTALEAKDFGLVDGLIYKDEVESKIENVIGKKVTFRESKKITDAKRYKTEWKYPEQETQKIALIYGSGGITTGESSRGFSGSQTMGSETIANAIRQAREDNSIKAIVFRIDSPGGSALASDIIWREVVLTTTGENKKPFIVSMSDVAASGGYYIACAADTIIALPTTITGSIGVLAGKFDISELLEKIGVNIEEINRGKNSSILSPFKPSSEEEREKIRQQIEWIYDDFTEHVADGRGIPQDSVRKIGKGRVWSGKSAKDIGLVDEIGGLNDAIEIAKVMAKIPEGAEVIIEIMPKWWKRFFQIEFSTFYRNQSFVEEFFVSEYKQSKIYFNAWLSNHNENIQMLMPYLIIVE
jgi:protease-4